MTTQKTLIVTIYTLSLALMLMLNTRCTEGSLFSEQVPFEFDTIPLKNKIILALEDDYLDNLGFTTSEKEALRSYYKASNYAPNWINDSMLTDNGIQMAHSIQNKLAFGIPETRKYQELKNGENFIQEELRLNIALSYLINDIDSGFLIVDSAAFKPLNLSTTSKFLSFTAELTPNSISEKLLALGPKDTIYPLLANYLFNEYQDNRLNRETFKVESIKKDTLKALTLTIQSLRAKSYLDSSIVDSTRLAEAIKVFQNDNELYADGIIGTHTANALNESQYHRLLRVALAMEKCKWKKEKPNKYFMVNLPEYKLRFYHNDSVQAEHNIVIGKLGNETPQFKSKVRKIVLYPYWNVPYSIRSKEILPMAQRNSNYFEKHNYVVLKDKDTIDPKTVNWKAIKQNGFPYKVIQQPGPKNSLGLVKFDMPNEHSIYIHDTPSKSLFGTKTRAYSHGCMRLQDPQDLAKIVLDRDENQRKRNDLLGDSIDSLMQLQTNFEIRLIDPIPVYLDYTTVVVENKEVKVFPDIYKREEEYLRIFLQ